MADERVHMAELDTKAPERTAKMGSAVLDLFTRLTDEKDGVRTDGGVALLRHLFRQSTDGEESKEMKYALTRIVRSLGASKMSTRKGFYSTLTVFLTMRPETPIEKILDRVDAELCPVTSNSRSENGDIYMGRILAYGALIRSKVLLKNSTEVQRQVIENLIHAGRQRSYLPFVSVSFLIEFLNQLDESSVKTSVWPVIEKEFGKPWSKQTVDTFYVLLFISDKYPLQATKTFFKQHLDTEDIVCKESMGNIVQILTDLSGVASTHHPVFKLFSEKLMAAGLVIDFWTGIDQKFVKPSKTDELVATEMLKLLVPNISDKTILPSLLSPNFLQHILKKFSNCKRNNNDEVLVAFKEFLNSLVSVTSKDIKSKTQISILKKLILYPGDLMIEKKTGTKVVQLITGSLNLDGIKKLSKLYREIIENTVPKEKESPKPEYWTNAERTYAGQLLTRLMGHPETHPDKEWRLEQLKFLFKYGLCEMPNVGVELAPNFKEAFYRALDNKLPKLNDLRNLLSAFVHYLDTELNDNRIKLRAPLTDEATEAWKKVVHLIDKLEKKHAEAAPVFHTMNLHMGLQLFSDAEMAITSINELQSCFERLTKKTKKQKRNSIDVNNKEAEEEPEWVEVVVDLLLSLLSRNSHLLRSLIGCVFPHICPYLTAPAVYQILSVLDVTSEKTPLTTKGSDDESEVETDNNDDTDESDDDETNSTEEGQSSSEEHESDLNEESMDEDETVTDRLRMAVSQALGDASAQTDNEDIDVDEIDAEEGKRLDESLAAAFKMLKENRHSRSKKQEKSAQALTHFRVRVMDLLEDYIDCGASMAVVLDMLVPLFALLEFCIKDPHQKPLEHRVRTCLKKLSTIKKFKSTEGVDDKLLTTVLKALIDKGERSASVCQEMGDKLAECCTFLVRCVQQTGLSTQVFVDIYKENLTSFFKKRDCILPAALFKSILQLSWEGNWKLAPLLVDFAFDTTIRSFRRGQALEFLTTFYKNSRLIKLDTEHTKIRLNMEKKLCRNSIRIFQELCSTHNRENGQSSSNGISNIGKDVKQKFIYLLLTLLHVIHGQHLPQAWNWQDIADALATYRAQVSLAKDAKTAYNKLAAQLGISTNILTKKHKNNQTPAINGEEAKNNTEEMEVDNEDTDSEDDASAVTQKEKKKRKKNRSKQRDKQLLKKETRELRAKTMSEGLEGFSFSSVVLPNEMTEGETLPNGNSHDEETDTSSPQKRTLRETTDSASKPKRKKRVEAAQ